jgi:hypothetical protein
MKRVSAMTAAFAGVVGCQPPSANIDCVCNSAQSISVDDEMIDDTAIQQLGSGHRRIGDGEVRRSLLQRERPGERRHRRHGPGASITEAPIASSAGGGKPDPCASSPHRMTAN